MNLFEHIAILIGYFPVVVKNKQKIKKQLAFEHSVVVNAQRIHEHKFMDWHLRTKGFHPGNAEWIEFHNSEHYVYLEKRRRELFKKINEL